MTEVMANHPDSQNFELKNLKEMIIKENERGIVESCAPHSNGECMEIEEPTDHVDITEKELLEKGHMQYGYVFFFCFHLAHCHFSPVSFCNIMCSLKQMSTLSAKVPH